MLGIFAVSLMIVAVPSVENIFALLATMSSASAIDVAIQRKMHRKAVLRTGKGIFLVTSNEELVDIFRIIKSLDNSNALIDGFSETIKMEI